MSMQDFRDGIRLDWPWSAIWRILAQVGQLAFLIFTLIDYHSGRMDQAIFCAIMVLWLDRYTVGKDGGRG